MPTVVWPAPAMTSASTAPWRMSEGALRKYRPLAAYVEKVFDVLAGENCTTPAAVILSITVALTPDDAAPMIASTLAARRRSTVWLAMSVVVSPESPWSMTMGLPSTPRSEEHTSELQSLMRISYAVICLKKHISL